MRRCRYCTGEVYRICLPLYECLRCKKFLIENLHGKLINYQHDIDLFKARIRNSKIKIKPDALAYGLACFPKGEMLRLARAALIFETSHLLIEMQTTSDSQPSLVIRAKYKNRQKFNRDMRPFYDAIRGTEIYISTSAHSC